MAVTLTTMSGNGTTYSKILNVTDVCSEEYPTTDVYYADLRYNVADIALLGVCVVLTLALCFLFTSELLSKHFIYRDKSKRTKTLFLMGIYPCTSVLACLSLLVPRSTVLVDLAATCYLSACIFIFVQIIMQYYGGTENMTRTLGPKPISIRNPPCCCCCFCFPKVVVTRRFLKIFKILIGQVAIVRPLVLFIQAVLWTDNRYTTRDLGPDSPMIYMSVITAISTLLAMYGLTVIVRASRKVLKKHKIRAKFLLLQFVLVFTNLQSAIFGIFYKYDLPPCRGIQASNVRGSVIHHMMVVMEMFLLGIGARMAYRKSDSHNLSTETEVANHVAYVATYGTVDGNISPLEISDSGEASPTQLIPENNSSDRKSNKYLV